MHVDYDDEHSIGEEHKPLYEIEEPKGPLMERIKGKLRIVKKEKEKEDGLVSVTQV